MEVADNMIWIWLHVSNLTDFVIQYLKNTVVKKQECEDKCDLWIPMEENKREIETF